MSKCTGEFTCHEWMVVPRITWEIVAIRGDRERDIGCWFLLLGREAERSLDGGCGRVRGVVLGGVKGEKSEAAALFLGQGRPWRGIWGM